MTVPVKIEIVKESKVGLEKSKLEKETMVEVAKKKEGLSLLDILMLVLILNNLLMIVWYQLVPWYKESQLTQYHECVQKVKELELARYLVELRGKLVTELEGKTEKDMDYDIIKINPYKLQNDIPMNDIKRPIRLEPSVQVQSRLVKEIPNLSIKGSRSLMYFITKLIFFLLSSQGQL